MPAFDLYGAWILPALPVVGTTYDATLGEFGTAVAPVIAITDGLTPDGDPYPVDSDLDPERIDIGTTFRIAGTDYVATRAWYGGGTTIRIGDTTGGGGIYIYEVTDGTTTLLIAFPNFGGLVRPDELQSINLYDLAEVTGTSFNLIWPGYNFVDNGTPIPVPCFVAGTAIACPEGARPVEAIRPGMQVCLDGGGTARVLWAGQRTVTEAARAARPSAGPIRIAAGALGAGLPRRDLRVSPQHRLLVASRAAARIAGAAEVLVAARHLAGLPGIAPCTEAGPVAYHHLLLDRHGVLLAEGAPAESLWPGAQALAAYPPPARLALMARMALIADPAPARPMLAAPAARRLIAAHARQRRPLLEARLPAVRAAA